MPGTPKPNLSEGERRNPNTLKQHKAAASCVASMEPGQLRFLLRQVALRGRSRVKVHRIQGLGTAQCRFRICFVVVLEMSCVRGPDLFTWDLPVSAADHIVLTSGFRSWLPWEIQANSLLSRVGS